MLKEPTVRHRVYQQLLFLQFLYFTSIGGSYSLEEKNPDRFSSNPERIMKLDSLAKAYYDQGLFHGSILVAHKGKIIFEKGYGYANFEWEIPNSPNTKFDLVSVSKQFTAMAIMILVGFHHHIILSILI